MLDEGYSLETRIDSSEKALSTCLDSDGLKLDLFTRNVPTFSGSHR